MVDFVPRATVNKDSVTVLFIHFIENLRKIWYFERCNSICLPRRLYQQHLKPFEFVPFILGKINNELFLTRADIFELPVSSKLSEIMKCLKHRHSLGKHLKQRRPCQLARKAKVALGCWFYKELLKTLKVAQNLPSTIYLCLMTTSYNTPCNIERTL